MPSPQADVHSGSWTPRSLRQCVQELGIGTGVFRISSETSPAGLTAGGFFLYFTASRIPGSAALEPEAEM